ncbi:MAG: hypothetical protein HKN78_10530, partial [Sphingomonadaceae bacterium]|nr:hypothetical protein [Sphingomonadaceae bacterium]
MKVTRIALAIALLLPPVAIAEIAVAQEAESDGGFSYDYPQIVEQLPGLLDHLAADRAAAQDEFETNRREFAEIAPDSAALDHLQYSAGWSIVGETPVLLSLGQGIYTYSGGAHGNSDFDALLWNKRQDRQLSLLDLFTNRYAALALIDAQFCPALRAEQETRFGSEVGGLW